ncbi:MAG: hypothetical protein JWL84_3284 [Rhodospirillales bacterium]|jgi:hypothetical protein|nr:hypothetical protein [Rhodospirillales bacterium]
MRKVVIAAASALAPLGSPVRSDFARAGQLASTRLPD